MMANDNDDFVVMLHGTLEIACRISFLSAIFRFWSEVRKTEIMLKVTEKINV